MEPHDATPERTARSLKITIYAILLTHFVLLLVLDSLPLSGVNQSFRSAITKLKKLNLEQ